MCQIKTKDRKLVYKKSENREKIAIPYKELIIWRKSFELVKEIYLLTESFPQKEIYGLTSQIRRAVVSISSNIAEGSKRASKKELAHFLRISLGSCAELETQFLLAKEIKYIEEKDYEKIQIKIEEVMKILGGFLKKM